MTNKEKFIYEIDQSIHSEGGLCLSDGARAFFDELRCAKQSNGELTEIGATVLSWVRDNMSKEMQLFSSKVIGEGLFLSPRVVTGAARKLVNDGYLYKEGKNPVCYGITSKGCQILPESH